MHTHTQGLIERNRNFSTHLEYFTYSITHITVIPAKEKKNECGGICAREVHDFEFYDYYLTLYCCDVMAGFCFLISFNLFVGLIEFHLEFDTVGAQHIYTQTLIQSLVLSLIPNTFTFNTTTELYVQSVYSSSNMLNDQVSLND